MTLDQTVILAIGSATVAMFLWGRLRHDFVAVGALLACVVVGLVPGVDAFAGFGHPAVITVACVLIMSRGLQMTGAVDVLAQRALPSASGPTVTIAALTGLAAVLSAFMNNVGALALLMPVALQVAAKQELPPGKVLMPLAFGSILGGMTTLIGTPPNLIVAAFRAETGVGGFAMFDFSPVGAAVAGAGVLFIGLVGWRIVPARQKTDAAGFDAGTYLTEVRVPEESKVAGKTLREIEPALDEADAQVVGLARQGLRVSAPNPGRTLQPGDVLVIEAEPESLTGLLTSLGLRLSEDVREESAEKSEGTEAREAGDTAPEQEPKDAAKGKGKGKGKGREADEPALSEVVVRPDSVLIDRSASDILLRTRYNINLLAIARQGHRSIKRLRATPIQAGDVLLLQGTPEATAALAALFGLVPLAPRAIHIPDMRKAATASIVMAMAIGGAALGLLPAAISFAAGALVFVARRIIPPRLVYEAVDWPVVVLLGALIPVAGAMASTGTADLLARLMLDVTGGASPVVSLGAILVITMFLSDFMNNAATAAVMCPIAISTAEQLGANTDPFLMAVAVGASCAFLTPIGHQNNTLILGPGGFRFGDYWRLGLLIEVIVVAVGIPMLERVWPL
jgi:di/tricarboxylate transporter